MSADVARQRPVRLGVVGVGQMGANHARVASELKGAELVAVVDHDRDRAKAAAEGHGARAVELDELADLVDAVCVAVPSVAHADVAGPLLERGLPCLVEKPLATTEREAAQLIDAAQRGRTQVLVGHIERFNPAVRQLAEILDGGHDVRALHARRMSAVSSRIVDVDVVTDLMIHDVDIALSLLGSRPVDVVARAVGRGGVGDDHVTALLTFADGTLATLTASRITQNKVRSLEVTTDERFFTVDYTAQELHIYRQGRVGELPGHSGDGRYVLDVGTERVVVRRTEPLVTELAHFLDVVRGEALPEVTADDALAAMKIVWTIQEQVRAK